MQINSLTLIWLFALLSLSAGSNAASENCGGKVTMVMDHPSQCLQTSGSITESHAAFQIESSAGKWICSVSTFGDSLVLAALAAGKQVSVRIDLPTQGDCSSIAHYTELEYVSVIE